MFPCFYCSLRCNSPFVWDAERIVDAVLPHAFTYHEAAMLSEWEVDIVHEVASQCSRVLYDSHCVSKLIFDVRWTLLPKLPPPASNPILFSYALTLGG
jgi:hypothetical protein